MNKVLLFLLSLLVSTTLLGQSYIMSNQTDTVCSGTFYDNGGPSGNYSSNTVLTQTFYSSGGERLEFDFYNFHTRNIFNYLEVHDGPDRTYPLVGKYYYNTVPTIIRSTGNALTFHFVSNGAATRYGWSANISCFGTALQAVNMTKNGLDTNCAVAFYDNGGWQANYRDSSNLTHTICSDDTSSILVADFSPAITSFNIGDTLWAYDGNDTTAKPLGVYVKGSRVETLASSDACLTFRFTSDSSNSNGRGWQAAITCDTIAPPPNSYLISNGTRYVCDGTFYDNGGSGNYPNNSLITQTLRSYNGNRMIVDFRWFVTDNIFDYLEIHDGPDRSYPLIGKYYYTSRVPDSIISTADALTFHWVTSGSGRDAGWIADISCGGPILENIEMTDQTVDSSCNAVFYDDGGKLGNYSDSIQSTHTLCSNDTTLHLKVNFNQTDTELGFGDTLWAYDGTDTTFPLLGAFVRSSIIEPLTSSRSCLTFRFKSDSSSSGKGWQAEVSCDTVGPQPKAYRMSTGTRYVCDGTFYDNGGTGNYPNNSQLTQTFKSYSGNRLKFNFRSFVTDNIFDYLEVHDGPDRTFSLIGKYYFTSRVPDSIISSGDALTFHWVTSAAGNAAGWVADINCIGPPLDIFTQNESGIDTVCTGVYYDGGGFNKDYNALENSVKTFCSADTGKFFTMRFNQAAFDLRSGDTLIAYDGTDTSAPFIGKYISGSIVEPILSESGCLTFQFKSDSTAQGEGWQAFFSCDSTYTVPEYRISSGFRYVCAGSFTDDGGSNQNYSNSIARTQTFQAKNGAHLQLIFSSFFTDNIFDDLRIYDGTSVNAPLIGRYYYNTPPPDTLTSSGRALTFVFSSNSIDNAGGWVADMHCVNEPPIPQITSNLPICSGEELILTAQTLGGVSYHWSGPNSFTSNQDSVRIPAIDTSYNGIYKLYVEKWGISSDTASLAVTVNNKPTAPTLLFSGNDSIFCEGDTVTLNSSYNFGNYWSNGDTTTYLQFTESDTVWVQHIDQNGCKSDSSFRTVLFNPKPAKPFIGLSGDTSICQGDSILLTSSYSNRNLWSNADTTNQITITQNGSYFVEYTGSSGCSSTSDTIRISTLQAPATPVISALGNTTVCQGDTVRLQSNYTDGNRWNTADSNQLISVSQTGTYYVIHTDSNGCVSDTSNRIQVTVNPTPTSPLITFSNGILSFCQGDSVQLNSSYSTGNLWNTSDTAASIIVKDSGQYFVRHTDLNGCESDTSNNINVQLAVPPAQPNISVIGNDTLDAGVLADRYEWFYHDSLLNGFSTQRIKAPFSGSYKVLAFNDSCASDTSNSFQLLITSLNELENSIIKLYPNPSRGDFNLEFVSTIEIAQLILFDQSGKVISKEEGLQADNYQIDLRSNPSGIYLLRLIMKDEIQTFKLIKY